MISGDSLWCMVLGAWFWVDEFGRMVWLWVYGLALGVWFWVYGFGWMVLGVWFWAYGFGRMVWTYDIGGTALQMRAGQTQKYIPILNRKIND